MQRIGGSNASSFFAHSSRFTHGKPIVQKHAFRYNHVMEQNEKRILTALKELGKTALGFGKAQVILFGVNITVITIGMIIAGLGWWSLLIAVVVSLLDLLPVIGSGIVFVPWAIIALIAKNPHMAISVGATYIAMVVLRMILDPIITGKSVGLSPWITLFASVGGLILFGGVGMILGPVIAAVSNVLFRVFFKKKTQQQSGAQAPVVPEEEKTQ
jgi:predicted PurR-regulated permease PerM